MILFVFELERKDCRPELCWAIWATVRSCWPEDAPAERTAQKWLQKALDACKPSSENPDIVESDFWESGNV